jgi:predicted nucleic acid-binding protein
VERNPTTKRAMAQFIQEVKSSSKYVKTLDKALEDATEEINPELSNYLKSFVETNLSQLMNKKLIMKLKLVVDANAVISEILRVAKGKESTILKLAKEPFLEFYAPHYLRKEIRQKIPKIAASKGLDEDRLKQIWREEFEPNVKFVASNVFDAELKAFSIIGGRDKKDVPYVTLSLSFESHGIITYDKDIIEQSELKTWSINRVKHTVTVMKQGSLILFGSATSIELLIKLLRSFSSGVVRAVIWFIGAAIEFVSSILSGAAKKIAKIPTWLLAVLGGLGIALILVLIFSEKARNNVAQWVNEFVKVTREMFNKVIENARFILKEFTNLLFPEVLEIAESTIALLSQIVMETLEIFDSL